MQRRLRSARAVPGPALGQTHHRPVLDRMQRFLRSSGARPGPGLARIVRRGHPYTTGARSSRVAKRDLVIRKPYQSLTQAPPTNNATQRIDSNDGQIGTLGASGDRNAPQVLNVFGTSLRGRPARKRSFDNLEQLASDKATQTQESSQDLSPLCISFDTQKTLFDRDSQNARFKVNPFGWHYPTQSAHDRQYQREKLEVKFEKILSKRLEDADRWTEIYRRGRYCKKGLFDDFVEFLNNRKRGPLEHYNPSIPGYCTERQVFDEFEQILESRARNIRTRPFPFMKLPPELRVMVYGYALSTEKAKHTLPSQEKTSRQSHLHINSRLNHKYYFNLAMLRLSKDIFAEAKPIWKRNRFVYISGRKDSGAGLRDSSLQTAVESSGLTTCPVSINLRNYQHLLKHAACAMGVVFHDESPEDMSSFLITVADLDSFCRLVLVLEYQTKILRHSDRVLVFCRGDLIFPANLSLTKSLLKPFRYFSGTHNASIYVDGPPVDGDMRHHEIVRRGRIPGTDRSKIHGNLEFDTAGSASPWEIWHSELANANMLYIKTVIRDMCRPRLSAAQWKAYCNQQLTQSYDLVATGQYELVITSLQHSLVALVQVKFAQAKHIFGLVLSSGQMIEYIALHTRLATAHFLAGNDARGLEISDAIFSEWNIADIFKDTALFAAEYNYQRLMYTLPQQGMISAWKRHPELVDLLYWRIQAKCKQGDRSLAWEVNFASNVETRQRMEGAISRIDLWLRDDFHVALQSDTSAAILGYARQLLEDKVFRDEEDPMEGLVSSMDQWA